ncbi:hypothetical protein [Rhodopseudomonas telluris]|uniref:Phasin domain-containing protein n=1 Tax=Rhodopseudomonas telluris TaxID=644215 RepID=A0ABV6EP38_9BRAD
MTLFPNLLTSGAKSYAPAGITFWENEETILAGMKEFAEGWFERRRVGTHAALETAKRISQAATPLDALREYQDWFSGAMARVLEDGLAFQQQFTKANARIASHVPQAEPASHNAGDDRLSA